MPNKLEEGQRRETQKNTLLAERFRVLSTLHQGIQMAFGTGIYAGNSGHGGRGDLMGGDLR